MDQVKIGKFIATRRKELKITQDDIASKLGISDRAVSKWERGINLPDASLMLELCGLLDITVNELLTGEVIKKGDYMKKAEERLVELQKANEEYAKKLLLFEWIIGFGATFTFLILIYVASYLEMENIYRIGMISFAIIFFFVAGFACLKIEQIAGFYKCNNCGHKYVPTYKQVFFAMHMGRTRYMKCPQCGKYSWNKKVV